MTAKDHAEIFLQPLCCAENPNARQWCEHDAPVDCEDGVPWTRYVRADLVEAERVKVERLREALRGTMTPDGKWSLGSQDVRDRTLAALAETEEG